MPSRTVDPVSSQPNVPATPHEPRRKSYDALFGDAPEEPWRPGRMHRRSRSPTTTPPTAPSPTCHPVHASPRTRSHPYPPRRAGTATRRRPPAPASWWTPAGCTTPPVRPAPRPPTRCPPSRSASRRTTQGRRAASRTRPAPPARAPRSASGRPAGGGGPPAPAEAAPAATGSPRFEGVAPERADAAAPPPAQRPAGDPAVANRGLTYLGVVTVVGVPTLLVGLAQALISNRIGWLTGLVLLATSCYAALTVRRPDFSAAIVLPPLAFLAVTTLVAGQFALGDALLAGGAGDLRHRPHPGGERPMGARRDRDRRGHRVRPPPPAPLTGGVRPDPPRAGRGAAPAAARTIRRSSADVHLLDVGVAALGQPVEHAVRPGSRAPTRRWSRRPCVTPVEPGLVDLARRRRPGTPPRRPASSATSTRRTELEEFAEPTTITRSASRGDLLDRHLAVLGGVADVVARRVEQQREPLAQRGDRLAASRRPTAWSARARRPSPGRATSTASTSSGPVDELDVLGRLAGGALDLLVALVADQQDVVVVGGEPPRLVVHLGDQRAGRVDGLQAARRRPPRAPPARRRARRRRRSRPRAPRRSPRRRSRRAPRSVATTCLLCTICLRT